MLMKIIKLYFLMALALLSSGCKGWLTIDSSDRIMENTLFETEEGFFTALNGVYAELPQASLYGKSLAAVTFDVQAQYFDTTQPSTHTFNTLGAYSAEARKTAVADTWDKAYFVIANVNKILEHCESDRDVLSDRAYHIIRGEMLGMRALLHFEMLRIFGPVFAEAPARVSIPYRTSSELTVTPLLPANEVAEKIAGDFTDALSELADWDPVRTEGRLNGETTGSVRYRSRHLRLNYFAVKALQARLAIYTGDRTLAGRLAGEVIDEAGPFFPFASREDVTGQTAVGVATQNSEDRIFSSEALFSAVNSKRTSDIHDKFFSNKLEQVNLLTMGELAVHNLYDSESDLRTYQWQTLKNTEGVDQRFFVKYGQVQDMDLGYASMVPVVRMAEMYLIAAECEDSKATAYGWLNALRSARKATSLPATGTLSNDLTEEYIREFVGEGQLFWYYKRLRKTLIRKVYSNNGGYLEFDPANYLFALPEKEQEHHK